MANAGFSRDHLLLEKVTRGLYKGWKRGFTEVISLPKIKESDNIHQRILKQYVIDYYYIYNSATETSYYSWIKDSKRYLIRDWNRLSKIPYKMNQYRQKHWYWEPINYGLD